MPTFMVATRASTAPDAVSRDSNKAARSNTQAADSVNVLSCSNSAIASATRTPAFSAAFAAFLALFAADAAAASSNFLS